MKLLEVSRTLPIPDGVTVEVKGRRVRVKGPRGTLQRECVATVVPGSLHSLFVVWLLALLLLCNAWAGILLPLGQHSLLPAYPVSYVASEVPYRILSLEPALVTIEPGLECNPKRQS